MTLTAPPASPAYSVWRRFEFVMGIIWLQGKTFTPLASLGTAQTVIHFLQP